MTGIDPATRRVKTDADSYEADFLVLAMGADYDMEATPGFRAGGFEYYTVAGAERLRDALGKFERGRVLVSVLGQPFKCPPAPFEGAFLLHEYFTRRGIRESVELSSVFPMQRPVPVTGEVAGMFRGALAARGIIEQPEHRVTSIDPATRTAQLANGGTLPYDVFIGIPIHRAPDPLAASGLAVNGWVPVDQTNLRTQFPGVYAIGDVCTGPRTVPKAGIFAEAAALVVADEISASIAGGEPPGPYRASGVCYAEFGDGLVSKVEIDFLTGPQPAARRHDPSTESPLRSGSSARPGERAGSDSDHHPAGARPAQDRCATVPASDQRALERRGTVPPCRRRTTAPPRPRSRSTAGPARSHSSRNGSRHAQRRDDRFSHSVKLQLGDRKGDVSITLAADASLFLGHEFDRAGTPRREDRLGRSVERELRRQ